MNFKNNYVKFSTLQDCLTDWNLHRDRLNHLVLSNEINTNHCRIFHHRNIDKYLSIEAETIYNHMYEVMSNKLIIIITK